MDYPASIAPNSALLGLIALDVTLRQHDGETVVFAYSQGALVASIWIELHADDPASRNADDPSFVLIGNPTRAYGGSAQVFGLSALPDTQYHVTDVVREYDPVADFPSNPTNVLALANAAAAFFFVHLDYSGVDIDDPANTTWTVGNTEYVFVPTENLPLLEPLRMVGLAPLADELNAPLKAVIDRAYDRNYPTADAEPETVEVQQNSPSGSDHPSGGTPTARTATRTTKATRATKAFTNSETSTASARHAADRVLRRVGSVLADRAVRRVGSVPAGRHRAAATPIAPTVQRDRGGLHRRVDTRPLSRTHSHSTGTGPAHARH